MRNIGKVNNLDSLVRRIKQKQYAESNADTIRREEKEAEYKAEKAEKKEYPEKVYGQDGHTFVLEGEAYTEYADDKVTDAIKYGVNPSDIETMLEDGSVTLKKVTRKKKTPTKKKTTSKKKTTKKTKTNGDFVE